MRKEGSELEQIVQSEILLQVIGIELDFISYL